MYKSFIFDVDGTILDTERASLQSLQMVLLEEGMEYELDDLRFALGIPGRDTLGRLNISDIDRVHQKWSQYELELSKEVDMFSGIEDVIKQLAGKTISLGIVTSKTRHALNECFEPLGLHSYFEHMICTNDTKKHKPHPDPLFLCLERFGVASDESIYIGDSIYDMQCAKAAGVKFGLALWGSKTMEGFELADYVFKEPKEVLEIVL